MQLVMTYENQVTTTSVLVAQKFEKNHKDVLESIRQLPCSQSFRERNFTPSSYKSRQNREMPMYIMSRDGFTLLVMSFTGAKAAQFREEFIDEFNRMEAVLRYGQAPILLPIYTERILSEPTRDCPSTHFNVFDASHKIMLFIESNIGSVNKYDIVDGSIGAHWARYRKDKTWAVECSTYMHEYTDNRGAQECKCYRYSELEHFNNWLINVYKTTHLYNYLHTKYSKEKNRVMLDKVESILPKLLKSA